MEWLSVVLHTALLDLLRYHITTLDERYLNISSRLSTRTLNHVLCLLVVKLANMDLDITTISSPPLYFSLVLTMLL